MDAAKVAFIDLEALSGGSLLRYFDSKKVKVPENLSDTILPLQVKDISNSALFRVFFPIDSSSQSSECLCSSAPLFPHPPVSYAQGIVSYMKLWPPTIFRDLLTWIGSRTYIPNLFDAGPGRHQMNNELILKESASKSKLIVFSHGLIGCRSIYSQWIYGMVSKYGYTVISMEHRDGSASASFSPSGEFIPYEETTHLPDDEAIPIRQTQLRHRRQEISVALSSLKMAKMESKVDKDIEPIVSHLASKIDWDDISLAGHSFGACTSIYIATNPIPNFSFKSMFLMDPWMIPLKKLSDPDFEEDFKKCPINIPRTRIVNSDSFHWDSNLKLLHSFHEQYDSKSLGNVFLPGTSHQDFGDFSTIFPLWIGSRLGLSGKENGGKILIDTCVEMAHELFSDSSSL